ncbi:MAG: ABC transporter substrate-binding protein [Hyphomicrobiaceae bacterium]|nr:ABC transporter substrate-binding protein [Hyphomicrobiaceae bacterium]
MRRFSALTRALPILLAFLAWAPALRAETVLKVALHSDLKIIDPVWTSALITTHHGYMIYDTLFANDDGLKPKPQMVDTWSVSPDKLTWTFKLRDGLEWHDGQPVTSADCIASLKRWSARDAIGQKLMSFVAGLEALDDRTFVMRMKEPYGLVIESLAKSTSNVPFMMPKRVAETNPNTQLAEPVGSGPFKFVLSEWKPGTRAIYVKNERYKPRAEPPAGFSGGKVAKVDRVEWHWIADPQTQVNALLNGEIDFIEAPPYDLMPLLEADPNIAFKTMAPMGRQYALRFNFLHKPFDNAKLRQAVAYAIRQVDALEATIGDKKYYITCKSYYPCGSPYASDAGWADKLDGDIAKGRKLVEEAGYDGTPIVLMQSTDNPSLSNLAPVAKAAMEKIGLKVDLQATDWQTVVVRRAKKDLPSAGGWNIFITSWGAIDVVDPVSTAFLNASCEKATFGWPCDAEIERLRDAFARESDAGKKKELATAVQVRAAEYVTHVNLGQYIQTSAFRKTVTGVLHPGNVALWNIEKK